MTTSLLSFRVLGPIFPRYLYPDFLIRKFSAYTNKYILLLFLGLGLLPYLPVVAQDTTAFTDIQANLAGVKLGSVDWGDYDSDGDLDVLITGEAGDNYISKIYRNTNGSFSDINAGLVGVTESAVAWGDYDNDGDLDIALTGQSGNGSVSLIYQNNNGSFVNVQANLPPVKMGAVDWGDYDQDGDLDLLISGDASTTHKNYVTAIYDNEGGEFTRNSANMVGVFNSSVAWGDYDKDGDLDILLMGEFFNIFNYNPIFTCRIYRNLGSNGFLSLELLNNLKNGSATWGDYDSDSDLDIMFSGFRVQGGRVEGISNYIYRNDNGNFKQIDTDFSSQTAANGDVAWGDYDNDGNLDILIAGLCRAADCRDFSANIYRNSGGIFTNSKTVLPGLIYGSVAWGDYDNDGDLDILLSGDTNKGPIARIYRNNSVAKNTLPISPTDLTSKVQGEKVTLSWSPGLDEQTPTAALSYNVYVGTSPGTQQKVSSQANLPGSYRQVATWGNAQLNTSFNLNNLPDGTYYWSVQAIDQAFAGSAFAPEQGFVIGYLPIVNAIAPAAASPGNWVTIKGNYFLNATEVRFNGVKASDFGVLSNEQIRVLVPEGATTGPVMVTTPNGTALSAVTFSVLPTITTIHPTVVRPGDVITITGEGFANVTAVIFNQIKQPVFTIVNSQTITTRVPDGATSGLVKILTPEGTIISPLTISILPRMNYDETFGGMDQDKLTASIITMDGGYLLGGYSLSGVGGEKSQDSRGDLDYWIVKTDGNGTKIWDKRFGGSGEDKLTTLLSTGDGSYLLGGYSTSTVSGDKSQASKGDADYWIVKVNGTGKIEWERTLGGNNSDQLTAMIPTADGGYLLGGSSDSDETGDKNQGNKGQTDYWLIKIDANGKKIWDKTYGGQNADNLAAIVATTNGYLLGGSSASGISGDKSQGLRGIDDYWVIRITEAGEKLWDKTFGGAIDYLLYESCGGDENPGPECFYYFGSSILSSLVATPDGGFLLGGSSNADKGNEKRENNLHTDHTNFTTRLRDYWVLKIDGEGNKIWDQTIGGSVKDYFEIDKGYFVIGDSELKSMVATAEGNFFLAGSSNAAKGRDKSATGWFSATDVTLQERDDYWLVKIDGQGNKLWDEVKGGLRNDNLSVIIKNNANEFVLGGTSQSDAGGNKTTGSRGETDYWLVKITDDDSKAWNFRYGGSGNEGFTTLIKTNDGGYLSGGYSNAGISGDKTQASRGKNDYWIVKSDATGRKLWDKRYGGSGEDYLNRIIPTKDGGYLLAGSSLSGISGDKTQASRGNRDFWIVKISSTGAKQWDKRYGGSGYDELKKVIQLSTGEYILAGYSNSPANGDKSQESQGNMDYWLVKVSSTGTKIWDKRYGGSLNEVLGGIVQTSESGFLLGGSSVSGISGDKTEETRGGNDFWLILVDKNGTKVWDKTYGGSGNDEAYSLGRSNGSNYFISGQSDSPVGYDKTRGTQGGIDFWFLKINSSGAKIWDKRFGGTKDDELRASIQTSDGGYLLAGKSSSNKSGNKSQNSHGSSDYWIVKTDADGMYQWDKRYGGSDAEELRAVIQTKEGGLLLAGKSDSGVSGDRTQSSQGGTDFWLVKVAPESVGAPKVVARQATPVFETKLNLLVAYPNPFEQKFTLQLAQPLPAGATIKLSDIQGKSVYQMKVPVGESRIEVNLTGKPAGMYLLQLQSGNRRQVLKMIKSE
ncbi:hypothetical protein AHMF7605_25270 [Adhaeribacter arboris]|uniref:Fibronectin type-III domain-containing protein n=1 Tax=Adhaeribacter arboris TaxID=2072846 RepID=A0A2T2YM36_9BACT|nr:FG-GAP-like repeat-containing protein [Adhaeribacter arboris]PSR56570.1 hypothetical protein AHMF7605_25270 [Adhaeribacter arboris]